MRLLKTKRRLALAITVAVFVNIISLLTNEFIGIFLTADKRNSQKRGFQCLDYDVGNTFITKQNYPDDIEISNDSVCITHVKKQCLENVSQPLLGMISHFTSFEMPVRCDYLIDVGNGDAKYPQEYGQYPYKLCKQWLPNPNHCIVYSFG